jgi:hypothetical protein
MIAHHVIDGVVFMFAAGASVDHRVIVIVFRVITSGVGACGFAPRVRQRRFVITITCPFGVAPKPIWSSRLFAVRSRGDASRQ